VPVPAAGTIGRSIIYTNIVVEQLSRGEDQAGAIIVYYHDDQDYHFVCIKCHTVRTGMYLQLDVLNIHSTQRDMTRTWALSLYLQYR
jgi:hypothetical protein